MRVDGKDLSTLEGWLTELTSLKEANWASCLHCVDKGPGDEDRSLPFGDKTVAGGDRGMTC